MRIFAASSVTPMAAATSWWDLLLKYRRKTASRSFAESFASAGSRLGEISSHDGSVVVAARVAASRS
jgi:hypothetical protein